MHATPRPAPRGFTLVELLVVIAIIGLISAAALPVVLPALNERRISESARLLQAVLSGARDAAIRANSPRGIRLLPDPVLIDAARNGIDDNNDGIVDNEAPTGILASNRVIPIEPAPNYNEGLVNLLVNPAGQIIVAEVLYSNYPNDYSSTNFPIVTPPTTPVPIQANPTSWYWNIRQGDKIRFNDSGPYYTVAGPMAIGPNVNPNAPAALRPWRNPERYINDGPPETPTLPRRKAEYLILVNGLDDDENGYVDDGFDGLDNNNDRIVDPNFNGLDDDGDGFVDNETPARMALRFGAASNPEGLNEQEKFDGTLASSVGVTIPPAAPPLQALTNVPYTIYRRPVVTPGARETTLPAGVVVDLTTWNAPTASGATVPTLRPERSRLPVDPYTSYVDIMVAPNGQVVQAGAGSMGGDLNARSPAANQPFYHFWLTEREGVVSPLWGVNAQGIPNLNPNYGATATSRNFLLPMPKGTPNYSSASLTGERRLVTLFVKTGQVVSNSIETFDVLDTDVPFYDAQTGIKESQ